MYNKCESRNAIEGGRDIDQLCAKMEYETGDSVLTFMSLVLRERGVDWMLL
jgi:hypothetical protein